MSSDNATKSQVCAEILNRPGLLETAFVAGDFPVIESVRATDDRIRRCLLGATSEHDRYVGECSHGRCCHQAPTAPSARAQKFTRS